MLRFGARSALPKFQAGQQARFLNIHEYASKQLLRDQGANTEFGLMCTSLEQVKEACAKIETPKKVVKAQILAGGRGKGTFKNGFQSGVHICENTESAMATAEKMLDNILVTKQTGEKGLPVKRLYVTETIPAIKRELYCALLLDRVTCKPMFVASQEGGMGIEELAATQPEKIVKFPVDNMTFTEKEGSVLAEKLGFTGGSVAKAAKQFVAIFQTALKNDATMVEINPLAETEEGDVMCIDAKVALDDNASFRHKEWESLADNSQKDSKEVEADKYDLNYIALDGNVGCMVNGAGLAMSTMDIIALYGQKPANFLDVGGSAKTEQIVQAFSIITRDPNVKCILVNIFGGIMKCDVIANGVIEAVKVLGDKLKVPIVVRLEGTNDKLGLQLLADSKLAITPANDLDDAAQKACKLVA